MPYNEKLVRTKLKGERMECNISQEQYFNSFRIALLFRYIYKGRLVKISENIGFFFYKEINMKLSLVRTREVPSKNMFACKRTRDKQYGGIMLNTCCKKIWLNVIVTD
jgi:hypothetical protein